MKTKPRLPKIFGEGCVLQQGENTRIWGWGTPGERVYISLRFQGSQPEAGAPGQDAAMHQTLLRDGAVHQTLPQDAVLSGICVLCAANGRFEGRFPRLAAGGPFILEIAGEDGQTLQVREVYVGEVFVCAGQSNMELPMRRVRVRFPEEFWAGGAPEAAGRAGVPGEAAGRDGVPGEAAGREGAPKEAARKDGVPGEAVGRAGVPKEAAGRDGAPEEAAQKDAVPGRAFVLHIYKVAEQYDFDAPLADHVQASWQAAVRGNLEELSAFSYFFGKEIALQRGVPVGILNLSLGGTPAEAWTSREGLKDSPEYLKITDQFREENFCKNLLAKMEQQEQNWYDSLHRQEEEHQTKEDAWHPITLPCAFKDTQLAGFCGSILLQKKFMVSAQQAGRAGVLRFGTLVDSDEMFLNGVKIGETGYQYPPRRYPVPEGLLREGENTLEIRLVCRYGAGRVTPGKALDIIWEDVCSDGWMPGQAVPAPIALDGAWKYRILAATRPAPEQVFLNRTPTGLYNGMVAPCQPYTVRAAVWYQGESNDSHPADYAKLLDGLILDWRRGWRQMDLPFVVVQLPNCGVDIAPGDAWPHIREAQQQPRPNVAMTVNLDLGEDNDLHPLNKKAAAQRAALAVRGMVYKEAVDWQSPRLEAVSVWGSSLRLVFQTHCRMALRECAAGGRANPRLFEMAGEDGIYYPAEAVIGGNTVRLRCGQVKKPCAVRYAWADAPGKDLLYGENGLCAAPFSIKLNNLS